MGGPVTHAHCKADMLLSGVGDATGFKCESNYSGPAIHQAVQKLGGLKNLQVRRPDCPVSDNTALHLTTDEALATGKEGEELLHEVASQYVNGMKDMAGRAPGGATIDGAAMLKPGSPGGYRIPYNKRSGGCGAAMRAMCIGLRPVTLAHYKAGMLLSGVGDAIGFKWEFNYSGPAIHKAVQKLGGLENLQVRLPGWPVSDDTVLHLATAEALATGKEGEELLHEVASRYVAGMKDMAGRAPGGATIDGAAMLKPGSPGGYRIPYNKSSGGCGAAMRAMCIGLRYPRPEQLSSLVAVAVETGRMTHTHPTGFLGSVASALFAAYAVQRRPIKTWGLGLVKEACPKAKEFVSTAGYAVSETERDWGYFIEKWERYLELRGLSSETGLVIWPDPYGPAERDVAYKDFSYSGWGGSSGHDAPMIALDALLAADSNWEKLMNRVAFHGGDSDSTAVIACCCWGLLYGTEGVPLCNYSYLEYRDRLENSAEKLYKLSHVDRGVATYSGPCTLSVSVRPYPFQYTRNVSKKKISEFSCTETELGRVRKENKKKEEKKQPQNNNSKESPLPGGLHRPLQGVF